MKQTLFSIVSLLFGLFYSLRSAATHVIAYDGYATCISKTPDSLTFKIDITLFRDEALSTVEFDADIDLGVYTTQTNGSLIRVHRVKKTFEEAVFPGQTGLSGIKQGTYTGTLSLPKNGPGYTFVFQRCCFSVVKNVLDDQGFDLRIEIMADMEVGDKTPSLTAFPAYYLKTGTRYAFPHSLQNSFYDSIIIGYSSFYNGGSDTDPAPTPPFKLPSATTNSFKTGYSTQAPLGVSNTCDYTSEPDSLILQVNQDGDYFLPLMVRCYKNGNERIYSRIFRIKAATAPLNYLNLALMGTSWTTVSLKSNTVIHSQDDLVLERSTDADFSTPVVAETGISYGMSVDLTDDSLVLSSPIFYRLKLNSNPVQYSNKVQVEPSGPETEMVAGAGLFKVYPNPAGQTVQVELPHASGFTLYSSNGTVLRQGTMEEGKNTMPLSGMQPGIYLLRIGDRSQKLVITH